MIRVGKVMVVLCFISLGNVFGKDVTIKVTKQDPFVERKSHPAPGVTFEVIDAGLGEITDVRCTKTARTTGIAKCRFSSPECSDNNYQNTYAIQLQREFVGFLLDENVFEIQVKDCSLVTPSEFSFMYKPKKQDIFRKSKVGLANVIKLVGDDARSMALFWESPESIDAIKTVVASFDSTKAHQNLMDSNNLAVIYADLANSYDTDSLEYTKYQTIAKSYERISVLTANSELFKSFGQAPFTDGASIEVTPNLKDYFKNIAKLEQLKEQLLLQCENCSTEKLEKGINLISSSTALNATSLSALKEISKAKKINN
jgi:hypothetical protein